MIGKNHSILKSGYHNQEFYTKLWKTISNGKTWNGDIKNKAKDCTFYWVRTTIIPVFDATKNIIEYVSIRTDITSQVKLMEKSIQDERMKSIGQFAANMSHDLKNPLSVIKISLENLKLMYGVDEQKQQQFEKIERSIVRMDHQITEVLDFVRKKPLVFNKTSMDEIIDTSLDSLTIPNTVKIISPEKSIPLICDKTQLVTVLINLILNGIQEINGVGVIEIITDEHDDEIIIQIKDSGKGIPNEKIDQIFEPLFTTKQQGTGLGLASVQSIIESHGGVISVTSPPTIFTITLPKILD